MPLLFVTSNSHKFAEAARVLGQEYGFSVRQESFFFRELDSGDLREIAADKARQAFQKFRVPLIVEDTGVFFRAYKNFPGVHPKMVFESIGFEGILRLLDGKNRKAFFHTCFCYADGKATKTFEAKLFGTITEKVFLPKKKRLPFEKIFIPAGEKKPLVLLGLDEKNAFSHRAKAARLLGKWLQEREKQEFIESL